VGGKVNDHFGARALEGVAEAGFIAEAGMNENRAVIDGGTVPFGKIVVDRHGVAGLEQFLHTNGADIACPAGDQHVHGGGNYSGAGEGTTGKCRTRKNQEKPLPEVLLVVLLLPLC
jgi:hypothetical protein